MFVIVEKGINAIMKKREIIDLILSYGSPTQKYVIYRDILSVDTNSPEMLALQEQIINLREVKKILSKQNENGWFGIYLHGGAGDSMDGSVSRLRELGVEPHHEFMRKAKWALYADEYPTKAKRSYPPVEEYNFSRAQTLANLHIKFEETDGLLIKFQNYLLDKYKRASQIKSLDEVSREIKSAKFSPGSRAYLPEKDFPWVSDFIVLGSSLNWKTPQTAAIITTAMENVARLAPIPPIFDYYNNHYVGPICGYSEFDNYTDCCDMPKGTIIFWLRNYNFLCLICDIQKLPYYFRQAEKLAERVSDDSLTDNLSEAALQAIEASYGFSGRWKNETQRKTDIYYKALQILNNAGVDF